jgi:hypothetical protein
MGFPLTSQSSNVAMHGGPNGLAGHPQDSNIVGNSLELHGTSTPLSLSNGDKEEGELSSRDDASPQPRDEYFSDRPVDKLHLSGVRGFYAANTEAVYESVHGSKEPSSLEADRDSSKPRLASNLERAKETDRHAGKASARINFKLRNRVLLPETSTRREGSESPYNPPVSIELDSHGHPPRDIPPSEVKQRLTVFSTRSDSVSEKDMQHPYSDGKTATQLRLLAKGALLGLVPHNIRFSELVREGINPTILKDLYDEVGIKVASVASESQPVAESSPVPQPLIASPDLSGNGENNASEAQTEKASTVEIQEQTSEMAVTAAQSSGVPQSIVNISTLTLNPAQPDTEKPLERKDVIARRLAAKANKDTNISGVTKAEPAKDVSTNSVLVAQSTEQPSQPNLSAETQAKEKNKAQTELARQRMEQLKKQGLVKSQQRLQDPIMVKNTSHEQENIAPQSSAVACCKVGSTVAGVVLPTLQHPLPDRPPEAEAVPTARIPGLFMTCSEPSLPAAPASSEPSVDPVPVQSKNANRKRPRASDFDEPIISSKKPLTPEARLVIDISDDEFLYGDSDDGKDTACERSANELENMKTLTDLPSRKTTTLPSQWTPASATLQIPLRLSDQDDLRIRDMEILEMRKRIATLEQRKRAKLAANRPESPGSLNMIASGPVTENSGIYEPLSNGTAATDSEQILPSSKASVLQIQNHSSDIQALASMDSVQIENIRQKFLRRKEIESGLPALEEELSKSEARLAEFRREEEKILEEIAKGKEGRRHLIEELESLGHETEGLNLEDLQALKDELEHQKVSQASAQLSFQNEDSNASATGSSASQSATLEVTQVLQPQGLATEQHPDSDTSQISQVDMQHNEGTSNDDDCLDAVPPYEKDNSIDSASVIDSSTEITRLMCSGQISSPKLKSLDKITVQEALETPEIVGASETGFEIAEKRPISPRTYTSNFENNSPVDPVCEHDLDDSSSPIRELSAPTDVYEPPEPRANQDVATYVFTPPFSPVPLDNVESKEFSIPPSSHSQADEALTGNGQVSKTVNSSDLEMLENGRHPTSLESPFSPYLSPLRYFKTYRFHSRFPEDVSGAYRSLTYSHNIDTTKCLCPFEAAGGVCNDRSCEFQHFRDLVLSDEKILVQMGSLKEGKTPEERDNYIAGLKQAINDLRPDQMKDFTTVATEIAAYRRRSLKDPSRVLSL